ncbi:MAG: DUF2163 domain-containing protein [Bacteroidales bacterium]|jgi:uncharacterized phage protein (TIGR02218 family)|nr:DUF2163 domain-containing protein [Bacteroidales bacterium]
MSKNIPIQLLDSYRKSGRSTAFLVRIKDDTREIRGFTNLDKRIRFDDGFGEVIYSPSQEMYPQNIESTLEMTSDNTELHGWFNAAMDEAVLAGKFANAEVTLYRVQYLNLSYGYEIVAFGTIGKIDYSADKNGIRKLEWKGYTDNLKDRRNDQFSLTCRNRFGDENCGMPFVWETATIGYVSDNRSRFTVTGLTRPDDYFTLGIVEFLDGPNAGSELEIEQWTSDGKAVLSFVTAYVITTGISVRFRQDCVKTSDACISYSNIANMAAEHLTPVENQSLMVPGAYVKSANSL